MPHPHIFPKADSEVLPDPSSFFSSSLLSSPLPTNSFFQNFTLKNGDQPEYIHPYLIKSSKSSLAICYPSRFANNAYVSQIFRADITISSRNSLEDQKHVISSFSDLSVTLDILPSLRFFLVRGSPYITCSVIGDAAPISISSVNAFQAVESNASFKKCKLTMTNGQVFLVYSSSPLRLVQQEDNVLSSAKEYHGVVRIAILLDSSYESVLDQFSHCYAVCGEAEFSRSFRLEYNWETKGQGDLLLLAHPLHVKLLDKDEERVHILENIKYRSIDGDLVGIVGDCWLLKTDKIPITWHSIKGVCKEGHREIESALHEDVNRLKSNPITTISSYYYGKLIARAARLALIAEEICDDSVIDSVLQFLKENVTPWLDGSFEKNGFLYNSQWGGLVTKQGLTDIGADFGFGIFNHHHFHLGYFLYAIAVLAKFDRKWGKKYEPQAYSMMADFMTLSRTKQENYTKLRCFDLWLLHSWAGGLMEFADGRDQESSSEALNGYYSVALLGLSYGDNHLVAIGSTLAAFEIHAAETWWHVKEGDAIYDNVFSKNNRLVGVLWSNKRDSALWFAPPDWKERRLGIQLLPLSPITEVLFRNVDFVMELVNWTLPALAREGAEDSWKGFVYALKGVYDKESALDKTKMLTEFDDGNSLSNMLWWLHSRKDVDCWSLDSRRKVWFRTLFAHCLSFFMPPKFLEKEH